MSPGSFDFRVGLLNIRGINKHSKRIVTFNRVKSNNFDITFPQETYSANANESCGRLSGMNLSGPMEQNISMYNIVVYQS